jgi:ribosome-binding factor A
MSSHRIDRVNELIRHSLAALILRTVNDPAFNPAAVTITHVITSPDLRHTRVLVSVNAPPDQQYKMIGILKHHRGVLQHEMSREVILKYTPHIAFELDQSIAQGAHVLDIISKLEAEHPDWPERPEPTAPVEDQPDDSRQKPGDDE